MHFSPVKLKKNYQQINKSSEIEGSTVDQIGMRQRQPRLQATTTTTDDNTRSLTTTNYCVCSSMANAKAKLAEQWLWRSIEWLTNERTNELTNELNDKTNERQQQQQQQRTTLK